MKLSNCFMGKNSMGKIFLDGIYLCEKEETQEYLKDKLDLPEYYGGNLDALYDCLTDFSDTFIEIRVPEDRTTYFGRVLRVFKEAARENENLTVEILSVDTDRKG